MRTRSATPVLCAAGILVLLSACSYEVAPSGLRGRRNHALQDESEALPDGGPSPASATVQSGAERRGAEEPAGTGPSPSSPSPASPSPPADDPGPPPTGCGAIPRDTLGFFTRTTSKGSYVGITPKGYSGAPTRLVVGLHGCGDSAYNFATWGVSPWATRDQQDWIAISVGGETGGGKCWRQSDASIVLAAIDDVSRCFYVHRHEVVLAGFSSGGELAYGMGLTYAARFAGILVENSALSAAGPPAGLLALASWKLPIAHTAHTNDSVFGIAGVRADWATIDAAGFPLHRREMAGGHDGTSADWTGWLLPISASWRSP
jgi:predicted esterase